MSMFVGIESRAKVAAMPKVAETIKEIRALGLTCVRKEGKFHIAVPKGFMGVQPAIVEGGPEFALQVAYNMADQATRP